MLHDIPRLADYDISPHHGFLSSQLPLEMLPDPYYAPWETLVRNLQGLILSRRLRGIIDDLAILNTNRLRTEPEWRRAYSVLAFLAHSYIWGGDTPAEVVPPSISAPFHKVCEHLELPTVAAYAGVVLWNFKPLFPDEPIDNLENISTLTTFSGSDESWFYLISVAIEARGAPIMPLMLDAFEAARQNDRTRVIERLQSFAERLDDLSELLVRMYENCDPHIFYHRIRPFLAGSKNMADAGLPNGVMFDDGTGTKPFVQYAGGSNAQSSLIQFFDIALGIEHLPTGSKKPTTSKSEGTGPPPPSHNFIKDMRRYMPGAHRRFLEDVETVANIKDYIDAHQDDRELAVSYDACLAMLRDFRDKHLQMVTRYIVIKSRESRERPEAKKPIPTAPKKVNLAATKPQGGNDANQKKLRGTGGTSLIPFLKQARDETSEPAIGSWARRILTSAPVKGFAPLATVNEHANGQQEIVGLAGIWSVDDSEGGICHW